MKKFDNPLLTKDGNDHCIGKNPLNLDVKDLESAGHTPIPAMSAIRKKCLDCCGFQVGEVRKCIATSCALWPYRMGKNPFRSDAAKRQKQSDSLKK